MHLRHREDQSGVGGGTNRHVGVLDGDLQRLLRVGVPQRFVGASVVVQDDLTLDADSADIDGYRLGRAKRIILGGLRGSASGAGS